MHSLKDFEEIYSASIEDPEKYWAEQARRLIWTKKWTQVKNVSFKKPVRIEWFKDAELNISYNCIDRHLAEKADRVAFYWEPDSPLDVTRKITYQELHDETCRMANTFFEMGVRKGDRVTIYLPMIPEAIFAMLACARMGAVHSVVFGGFSAESLNDRIVDCQSRFLVTTDFAKRGGKDIPLKKNADAAIEMSTWIEKVLVIDRRDKVTLKPGRDFLWSQQRAVAAATFPCESMNAEDPLFILYTSGSTGKPKGVLHTSGGYLLYAAATHEMVFNYKNTDVYWCTADVGWITGHSYIVYGPLANAATSVIFEGVPNFPDCSRFWQIIDKYRVSLFYTAPTAIRALMSEGDAHVKKTSRHSLRLLGSVGEPINPEAWRWYHEVVGEKRCPVVDTWWQTETGGILISPIPDLTPLKPGSATLALPGIKPELLSTEGTKIDGAGEGLLVIADSWPGQMRTVYRDHARFEETYFSQFTGYYFTGDGCRRDDDGYFWITGRVDDVLNVSGHRIGTAELESAFVAHASVAEAGVVGFPHPIKGQGIYAFITLRVGVSATPELKIELTKWIADKYSPIGKPDLLQWAPALPKTRSGKIMRRILRKIAENQIDQLGDISTLADPSVVERLVLERLSL